MREQDTAGAGHNPVSSGGMAESREAKRHADWTKAGTGVNSPTSPGSTSLREQAPRDSVGSNPTAAAHPATLPEPFFGQFISDVHTAAGLVEHGRRCKPLAERLSEGCMRLLALRQGGGRALTLQEGYGPATERLHTFLDAAAGEGLVLDGIDAADLYITLFPERYAAATAGGTDA